MRNIPSAEEMNSIVITDCGSTTTKAIWFEKTSDGWRQTYRTEAPTTVEKPLEDVTIGVQNSLSSLSLISKREQLINENGVIRKSKNGIIDCYFSTSSAGGGLQMVVLGIVSQITGKSAERAALGAGAIVLSKVCLDDDTPQYEQASNIRELRPDIILLTGGTNGGAKEQLYELAEILLLAEPKPRFGEDTKVPLIYAGNEETSSELEKLLSSVFTFIPIDNVRPDVDTEKLEPAREAVHDIFLEHVMSQAPGYSKLASWADGEIMPTPVGVSKMIEVAAKKLNTSIIAVDIGGATTDIFSIRKNSKNATFMPVHRTVSANLGMSYSIGNVVNLAGTDAVKRWLPFEMPSDKLKEALWNKMFRPTTIPQTIKELHIEQAVAREALRLSFEHHKELTETIVGVREDKDIGDTFKHEKHESFQMSEIDFILGSGGVLSHAPNRAQAALMLIDSFEPEGITFLGVDSIFMLPHLGVFSEYNQEAALEILFSSCIIPLGTVISPFKSNKRFKPDRILADIILDRSGENHTIKEGQLLCIPLEKEVEDEITIIPKYKHADFGNGPGKKVTSKVKGGEVGLIIDARRGIETLLKANYKNNASFDITQYQKKWNELLNINLP